MVFLTQGRTIEYGPIMSYEDHDLLSDRVLFNGDQFVSFRKGFAEVIEATAGLAWLFDSAGKVILGTEYNNYKDLQGNFRFVDSDPVDSGSYIGTPGDYNYILIGYSSPIYTDEIKIWSKKYIDENFMVLEYGDSKTKFTEVTDATIMHSYDDSLKHSSSDAVEKGQHIYTIKTSTPKRGKYWRIRNFLYTFTEGFYEVTPSETDITVLSVENWESYGDVVFVRYPNTVKKTAEITFDYIEKSGDYFVLKNTNVITTDGGIASQGSSVIFSTGRNKVIGTYVDNNTVSFLNDLEQEVFLETTLNTSSLDLSTIGSVGDITIDEIEGIPLISNKAIQEHEGTCYISYFEDNSPILNKSYTAKTSTSLTFSEVGNYFYPGTCLLQDNGYLDITQVRIGEDENQHLDFWFSDGTKAISKTLGSSDICDVFYDSSENIYYSVSYDTENVNVSPNDSFVSYSGSYPDTRKWDLYGNLFKVNTSSGTLTAYHPGIGDTGFYGDCLTRSYIDTETFKYSIDTIFTTSSGVTMCYLSDYTTNNFNCGFAFIEGTTFLITSTEITDATEQNAAVTSLSMSASELPEGGYEHIVYYTDGCWYYDRNVLWGSGDAIVGKLLGSSDYIYTDCFSFKFTVSQTLENGAFISFTTTKADTGPAISDGVVELEAISFTQLRISYNSSIVSTFPRRYSSYRSGIVSVADGTINTSISNFELTGGSANIEYPIIQLLTLDATTELAEVTGISDSDGVAIVGINGLRDPNKNFRSVINSVAVTTDQKTKAEGGSVFIKIGSDLYKYNKSSLPITSIDDGSSAVVVSSGVLTQRNILGFMYDGYIDGGLSYLYSSKDLGYYCLQPISSSSLTKNDKYAVLDTNYDEMCNFVRDVGDAGSLYKIDSSGQFYIYNIDPDDVSFCNIVADTQSMQADSGDSCKIKAFISNLYGDLLEDKQVSFSVSQGDGIVSPVIACTTSSGTAETTFYVGQSVGNVIINASASNSDCS